MKEVTADNLIGLGLIILGVCVLFLMLRAEVIRAVLTIFERHDNNKNNN